MKTLVVVCCFTLSLSAVADIVPPPANYSIAADDTVIDATGQVNDDPEQVISLTATEIPIVQNNRQLAGNVVKQDWKIRHDDALKTAP